MGKRGAFVTDRIRLLPGKRNVRAAQFDYKGIFVNDLIVSLA